MQGGSDQPTRATEGAPTPSHDPQDRSPAPSPSEPPHCDPAPHQPQEGQEAGEGGPQATPPRSPAAHPHAGAAASPSTPTRSPSSSRSTAGGTPQQSPSHQQPQQQPHSSSPAGASHANSSPSSTHSAADPTSSPSSSSPTSSSSASSSTSRRVKVYKLKDDAWLDLGTGTCAGVFLQANDGGGEEGEGENGGEGGVRQRVREEDEGAWIVVRREKPVGAGGGKKTENGEGGSPTKGKGKNSEEGEEGKMLVDEGEGAEGGEKESGKGAEEDASPNSPPSSSSSSTDEDSYILRIRVQPYPPGYIPDDLLDEDEITSLDDNGNATIDAGGYQRQQDTLIVWTERSNEATEDEEECEMALSFATSSGCSEMWEFIKAARRFAAEQIAMHSPSPSPSISSDRAFPLYSSGPSSFSSLTTLPEPSLGNLSTLEAAIRTISRTTVGRERAANIIVRSGFVDKLVKVHQEAEDLESLEDLHALCRVMQTTLLLNDSALFDLVIKDEYILGVVGMLEYDPDFPTMRASYRLHLSSPSSFVSVVPSALLPPSLLEKIHHTHRLHYLKDVVLARILEDSTFSMLNSHIYFNEVDIVNEVAGARELVREVFRVLEEESASGGAGGESRGREATTTGGQGGKGKEREREVGLWPKRTIGPDLPDLILARAQKKPRLDDSTSASFDDASGSSSHPPPPPPLPSSHPSPPSSPPSPSPHLRKLHATLFLSQLAQMAKNLQLPVRTSFYKTLCDRGLLSALEGALRFSDRLAHEAEKGEEGKGGETEEEREKREKRKEDAKSMRGAALGLWMNVVDLDAVDVRAYCFRQGKEVEAAAEAAEEEEGAGEKQEGEKEGAVEEGGEEQKTMLGVLIEMFKKEEDLGVKTQLAEALRVLVDVAGEGGPLEAPPRLRQEDPEAEKFLQYFYDHCMLSLVQPLMDLPERGEDDPPLPLSSSQIALLSHTCDLLCFFISHHTFRSKYLVLSNPSLAKSIARLLRPRPRLTRHTHLRLAALRFIRAIVARTDDFYNRFLVKHDLVRPVLETADEEKDRDNLLGSACLEFFEYLRTANAKALLNHLMDRSGDTVRRLASGDGLSPPLRTFTALINRWEMNNEPPPLPTLTVSAAAPSGEGEGSAPTSASMQRQRSTPAGWNPRQEVEEESYFYGSDSDEEDGDGGGGGEGGKGTGLGLAQNPEEARALAEAIAGASFGSSRRKRAREVTFDPSAGVSSSSSSFLAGAQEGDEKGDEVKEENGDGAASGNGGEKKRPRLENEREGMLPRSKTLPGGGEGEGVTGSLLGEYLDEEGERKEVKEDDDALAGGFIREEAMDVDEPKPASTATATNGAGSDGKDDKPDSYSPPSTTSTSSSAPAPPRLSLGELKRKKEEDDDGELGLLATKKKPAPSPRNLLVNPFASSSSNSSSTNSTSIAPAPPKQGGFKIAFGGFKSKFGGGGASAKGEKKE